MLLRFVSGLWLVRGDVLLDSEGRPSLPMPLVPAADRLLPRPSRRSRLELTLLPGEPTALRLILQPKDKKGGPRVGIAGLLERRYLHIMLITEQSRAEEDASTT